MRILPTCETETNIKKLKINPFDGLNSNVKESEAAVNISAVYSAFSFRYYQYTYSRVNVRFANDWPLGQEKPQFKL